MANKRKNVTEAQSLILYNQVDGICIRCQCGLLHKKRGRTYKSYEVAHIYPLHPLPSEAELLEDEERLSEDLNSLDNLIPLCRSCHGIFDKPRTVEEYRELVALKKKLIAQDKSQEIWGRIHIDSKISDVIEAICASDLDWDDSEAVSYNPKNLDKKTDNTLSGVTKRKIKANISSYFPAVRRMLADKESADPGVVQLILCQVRTAYAMHYKQSKNQQQAYDSMVEWLHTKTGLVSRDACDVVVSFFAQNCEVFD
jgi:hypothetical protein